MVFQATAFAAPSASATNTLVLDESTSESETESKDTANEGDTQGSTVNTPTVGEDEDQAEQPQETSVVNFELQLQLDFKIKKETLENLKGLFLVSLQRKESTGEGSGGSHVHAIVKRVEDDLVVFQAEDVAPGEYRLRMETEYYFQDFEQDVTIKQGTKTTLVFSDSYTSYRGEGKVSPGVYALGDLDTDGTIDEKDSKVLLEHIGTNAETVKDPDGTEGQEPGDQDSQDTVSEDPDVQDTSAEEPEGNPPEELVEPSAGYQQIYDLNQDGKLDIGDLGILVYNMGQEKREATPIETVLKTTVKVAETQERRSPRGNVSLTPSWRMLRYRSRLQPLTRRQ